jgi:hypothetical protein
LPKGKLALKLLETKKPARARIIEMRLEAEKEENK